MSQRHYRSCHLCETMCGIEVEYEGEKILAIRADKDEVLSQGNICPKATGLQDIHTDPDRLRKPLRRVRKNRDVKPPNSFEPFRPNRCAWKQPGLLPLPGDYRRCRNQWLHAG